MAFNIHIASIVLFVVQIALAGHDLIPRAKTPLQTPEDSANHALKPRQTYDYCPSGQVTCGDACIFSSYTCCADSRGGGCRPGTYCTDSGGCCPEGRRCTGNGGIEYYTNYESEVSYTPYTTYFYGPTIADYTYTYYYFDEFTSYTIYESTSRTTSIYVETSSSLPSPPLAVPSSEPTLPSSEPSSAPPEPTSTPPFPNVTPSSTFSSPPTSTSSVLQQTASGGASMAGPMSLGYPFDKMSVAGLIAMILALVTDGIATGL